ncbi:hypothetical protein BSB_31330 [Bacillus stercoris]|nr:hypothetical protein BSB_31330 [Bacillus stercoris]
MEIKQEKELILSFILLPFIRREVEIDNKNVFGNENIKLRIINLEYDYKEKFTQNHFSIGSVILIS